MDEKTEKAAFAAFLFEIGNVPNALFIAARSVHPENIGRALWIAKHWEKDAEVLANVKALQATKIPFAGQPDKEAAALDCWQTLQLAKGARDFDAYAKLHDKYARLRDWADVTKGGGTTVNVNTNRVMVVKDFGTDEEWEKAAARQQHDLTHGKHVVH